ncbi:MAG: ParA family protein [Rhodothermaceae bacterium]|nr:ParA family protein [Rhodothermaceae bacterium]
MQILSICSHKGGTGKTTTAINLSSALGLTGHKTLVIDMDPQGFLTSMLGLPQPQKEGSCIMLFEQGITLHDIKKTKVGSIDVLPSSSMMTSKMRHLNKAIDVFWVKEAIGDGGGYDNIVFDTAAAITVFSLNALVASDHVLIPVTPEYQPVMGAEQTVETVKVVGQKLNPKLGHPKLLLTQVDARRRTHQRYREYLRQKYGKQVLPVEIRTCSSLANSYKGGATVFDIDLNSRGAQDYARLTDSLLPYLAQNKTATMAPEAVAQSAPAPPPEEPDYIIKNLARHTSS